MINTPWGEIEVGDAHVHFFSPAFYQSLAEQKGSGTASGNDIGSLLGWEIPESPEYLADRWVVELNHNKVDRAVLIGSIHGDMESVGIATDRHPTRFRSVVMMNPLMPGADIRCQAALGEGLIDGIFLFPAMHRFSMAEQHVRSLLAIISGHPGTVVYVHCGMLSVGVRGKLGLPSQFDMRYSNPIDLHGVALEFPRVNFVVPHFGAGYFREALMLAKLCPNIYFDTSSSNSWMACQDQPTSLAKVFGRTLDVVGPNRLLFGSDSSWFRRGWVKDVFETQVAALSEAGIDAEAAKAIFGGNLQALFAQRKF
jgi:predicted TIM-barrel fold metal-dependent hydrolase